MTSRNSGCSWEWAVAAAAVVVVVELCETAFVDVFCVGSVMLMAVNACEEEDEEERGAMRNAKTVGMEGPCAVLFPPFAQRASPE